MIQLFLLFAVFLFLRYRIIVTVKGAGPREELKRTSFKNFLERSISAAKSIYRRRAHNNAKGRNSEAN